MKKYNHFINEYNNEIISLNNVTEKKLIDIIEKYSLNIDDKPIYKGMDINEAIITSKRDGKLRNSRNSKNYTNIIINGDDTWKKYSKRNLICSSNYERANSYGTLYRVFPLKSFNKINICPKVDIFFSFDINGNIFNHVVNYLLNYLDFFNNDGENFRVNDCAFQSNKLDNINLKYPIFKNKVKNIFQKLQKHINDSDTNYSLFMEKISNLKNITVDFDPIKELEFIDFKNGDIFQNIIDYLNPEKNSFNNMQYNEYKNSKDLVNNEIWLDCDAILIKNDLLQGITKSHTN